MDSKDICFISTNEHRKTLRNVYFTTLLKDLLLRLLITWGEISKCRNLNHPISKCGSNEIFMKETILYFTYDYSINFKFKTGSQEFHILHTNHIEHLHTSVFNQDFSDLPKFNIAGAFTCRLVSLLFSTLTSLQHLCDSLCLSKKYC